MDNVDLFRRFGRDQVDEAIEVAGLTTLIDGFDTGLDERLSLLFGEGAGRDLSGGQWQRLALARALANSENLVLLDEPSASLDPEAELAVLRRLSAALEQRTCVIVTHRLPLLSLADMVVVLREGRVVEHGVPGEMLDDHTSMLANLFSGQDEAWRALAERRIIDLPSRLGASGTRL